MIHRSMQYFRQWRRARSAPEVKAFSRTAAQVVKEVSLPSFREAVPEFQRELARARRYQRPVSLLLMGLAGEELPEAVFRLAGHEGNGRGNGGARDNGHGNGDAQALLARTTQLVSFVLGWVLRDSLRESDVAAYVAGEDRYVVLLAETTGAQAEEMLRRLNHLFYQRVAAQLRSGRAEFPTDGLTLDELLFHAQSAWAKQAPAVAPLAAPLREMP